MSTSICIVNPTLATSQDLIHPNGPGCVQFEQSHHMEKHGRNVSNTLSTYTDLKQIPQVPLAFREKWSPSMCLSDTLDKKTESIMCVLNFDEAKDEPDRIWREMKVLWNLTPALVLFGGLRTHE